MTRAEVQAQEELGEVVDLLKEIHDRLRGIAKRLPAPENAAMLLGEEDLLVVSCETAAEERETEENLQFYEEHKCEINPDLFDCQKQAN